MTDESMTGNGTPTQRRTRPLLLIGGVLWTLCFAAILVGWSQWRHRNTNAVKTESADSQPDDDDDGRVTKTIKLVPQQDGSLIPQEVSSGGDDNPWDAEGIADFSFTDTDGQTISKQDLIGKPFVIAFVFTHCRGPCPNVTLQMRELQDRLKDYAFNLVTLTVDPERDTPEMLQKYGKDQGADFGRWKFLTGPQADIYGLIQRSFKMPVEEVKGPDRMPGFEIIHSTNIMLVDEKGRVIGKFNATKDEEMAKLRKEIKRVAKLKSAEENHSDKEVK